MKDEKKRKNPNLAQVWLSIPKTFLERFDRAIQGFFPSRSEAIRRGMSLILEEIKRSREEEWP